VDLGVEKLGFLVFALTRAGVGWGAGFIGDMRGLGRVYRPSTWVIGWSMTGMRLADERAGKVGREGADGGWLSRLGVTW
jgi:hypothetical protein